MPLRTSRWEDEAPARPSLRASVPFGAVVLLGVLSSLLPPYSADGAESWWGLAATAFALALTVVGVRRSHRTWIDPVGP